MLEEENAGGQGHTGLLLQDSEGDWWYYYWGPIPGNDNVSIENIWKLSTSGDKNFGFARNLGKCEGKDMRDIEAIKEVLCAYVESEYPKTKVNSDEEKQLFVMYNSYQLLSKAIYFEGDYSASCSVAQKKTELRYHLLASNCLQRSNGIMMVSDWRFGLIGRVNPLAAIIPNLAAPYVSLIPTKKEEYPWILVNLAKSR